MVYPTGPSQLTEATVAVVALEVVALEVVALEVVVGRSTDNAVVCIPPVCDDVAVVVSIVLELLSMDVVEGVSLLELG